MHLELYQEKSDSIPKKKITKVVQTTLKVLKRSRNISLSVALVKESTGRLLNKTWRKKDRAAAVLSFSEKDFLNAQRQRPKFIIPFRQKNFLGEIIMAPDVVKREARQKNSTYQKEFNLLFIHGLLHLLGYHHESEREGKAMERLENKIIDKL